MKIVVPVEIELNTYETVDEVINCIDNCFNYDTDYYCITDKDVVRKNFAIDVLEEALKKVKER